MDNRREFIKKAAKMGIGTQFIFNTPLELIANNRSKISLNDKINFGVIGCNGMGWSDMTSILKNSETDCIALCDVDDKVLEERSQNVKDITGKKPKIYKDYRKLLENKDIDAVVIGTPDHWHCLNLVDALHADKHIYCEKPISNSIEEADIMLKASIKAKKCVQVGQWQRSGGQYREALNYLWSGNIGKVRLVKVWAYMGWYGWVDNLKDTKTPKGVDYKMWLGPAPLRKFNKNRFHGSFRWYWDYAGGLMTDWGVHEIDIALWGMNAKNPLSISAAGGKFAYPNQDTETPDSLQTIYEYNDFTILWEHSNGIDGGNYGLEEGIAFIGSKGTIIVNRTGWEVIPEKNHRNGGELFIEGVPRTTSNWDEIRKKYGDPLDLHTKNFIDSIKKNDPSILNCGIESGSQVSKIAHMGNVAYRSGSKIRWNDKKNNFDDSAANNLIIPKYNNGWKLPSL